MNSLVSLDSYKVVNLKNVFVSLLRIFVLAKLSISQFVKIHRINLLSGKLCGIARLFDRNIELTRLELDWCIDCRIHLVVIFTRFSY